MSGWLPHARKGHGLVYGTLPGALLTLLGPSTMPGKILSQPPHECLGVSFWKSASRVRAVGVLFRWILSRPRPQLDEPPPPPSSIIIIVDSRDVDSGLETCRNRPGRLLLESFLQSDPNRANQTSMDMTIDISLRHLAVFYRLCDERTCAWCFVPCEKLR